LLFFSLTNQTVQNILTTLNERCNLSALPSLLEEIVRLGPPLIDFSFLQSFIPDFLKAANIVKDFIEEIELPGCQPIG